jgi:hypothetical protein
VPESVPQSLLPLSELELAHDFAIEQHSPATRKAYRSDFALFALWCTARGLKACLAAPEAICAFIADEAMNGTKVSTITRWIAAIRYAHALKGIDPLPTSSEAVKATMNGIRRTRGAAQARKAPATHGIIADMIASCPETLRGTRAILTGTQLKPVLAVSTWLEAAVITNGPQFRAIDRHGNVLPEPLSNRSIAEIVKKHARPIGLDADQFSNRSARRVGDLGGETIDHGEERIAEFIVLEQNDVRPSHLQEAESPHAPTAGP